MTKQRVLIIGGGIAGLRVAVMLDPTMYEVEVVTPQVGGLLAQHYVEAWGDTFTYDFGGHVYGLNTTFSKYIERFEATRFHDRNAIYMELNGNIVPYPVQDFSEQLTAPLKVEWPGDLPWRESDTMATFAYEAFGEQFVDGWFRPFNERVWTVTLEEMASDWLATRVKIPDKTKQQRTWGPNNQFLYCPGHIFIDAMQGDVWLNGHTIRSGQVNTIVKGEKELYAVIDNYNLTVEPYDIIINTSSLAAMLETFGHDRLTPYLISNNIAYAGVSCNREYEGTPFTWAYGDIGTAIHRFTHLSQYHECLAPEGMSSFLFEAPYRAQQNSQFMANVMYYMQMLGFSKDEYEVNFFSSPGYPIPMMGARPLIATAKRDFADQNIFSIGRWGSHAYLNADNIFDEADNLAAYLNGDDTTGRLNEYLWSDRYYSVYRDGGDE